MAPGLQSGSELEGQGRPRSSTSAIRRWFHFHQPRGDPQSHLSTGAGQPQPSTFRAQGRHGSSDAQAAHQDLVSRDPGRSETRRGARTHGQSGRSEGYDEPRDFQNLGEIAAGHPASTTEGPSRLERALSSEPSPRRRGGAGRRRDGSRPDEGITETAAGRPVSSSGARHGREQFQNGDTDERSLSAPAPSVYQSPRKNPPKPKAEPIATESTSATAKWLTKLYTISYLIFFAFIGTLARLGMQWITFYPGAPIVTPVVWANFAGSVFMGFLAEDQGLFRDHFTLPDAEKHISPQTDATELEKRRKAESSKTKKTIPLYIGLATGFCGSFTSFSSFARDFFLALSNDLPTPIDHPGSAQSTATTLPRNGGYSFEAWAADVFFTLALSLGGLIAGAHLALFLTPYTPRISRTLTHRFLDPLMIPLGWGCWLGAILLCIWPPDRPSGPATRGSWSNETWRGEVLFALVLAPLGCLLRFYASLKLNPLVSTFPLGTFAVNMFGTAIEGMCYDIQHVGVGAFGRVGGGRVGCQVLQGVMDGFCGCLTTVSTWVAEINSLRRSHAWRYAFASVAGGLCLMVIIMGSVRWSVGYRSPACNTGYPDKIHG